MKPSFIRVIIPSLVIVLAFASCSKSSTTEPLSNITSITLSADKSSIKNDGVELANFIVTDNNGKNITSQCSIYNGTVRLTAATYTSTVAGVYHFTSRCNNISSNEVSINVSAPIASSGIYTRKAYVEDFTGAWCGWCPLMAYNLDDMSAKNKNIIYVGVHDNIGDPNNDKYGYPDAGAIELLCPGFQGFPTALVNRSGVTDQFNIVNAVPLALAEPATAGLKIETTVSGTTLNATITAGFQNDYSSSGIKLAVMLVEDSLLSDQHTYYYQTPYVSTTSILYTTKDLLVGWVNNGVLRSYATSVSGDAVPSANTTAGNTSYKKTASFNLTGYKTTNCRVVAILIQDATATTPTRVLNVQAVKTGATQNFD